MSTPASGLGLYISSATDSNVAGKGVDGSARATTRGSMEPELVVASNATRLWNGATSSLSMEMATPGANSHHIPGRNDDRNRGHGSSRSNGDAIRPPLARHGSSDSNGLAEFSILSPPDSSGDTDKQIHQGLDAVSNSRSGTEAAILPSTTTWGTTGPPSQPSRSAFSGDDTNLNGRPSLPSRLSLNLNITGLHDFEAGIIDADATEEDFMAPSVGRHSDMSSGRRFGHSRHSSIPDGIRAGMTPRVISRSVSDKVHPVAGGRPMESDSEEEELEIAAMRFSQSFSEVEPALSGSSTHAPASIDAAAGRTERSNRRRASTSVTLDLASLEADWVDIQSIEDEVSGHSQLDSRSVTFSTPRPRPDGARSQVPQTNGSKSHALYTSFAQKRPQDPKTVPATPYVNTTRVMASSSAGSGANNPMHRGVATIAAPPRPLPSTTYNPTYTSVRPSNGQPLPAVHYTNPYVPPAVVSQNNTDEHRIYPETQQSYTGYTLQPVSAQTESSSQPRLMSSTTQVPVLHAPQPVSGKSHIGRPWRDWGR